jgi:acetyl-CoA acyltransferase
MMGMGPVSATRLALERANWKTPDVDVFELNEAFSSQSIACIRELGLDPRIVNIDGGAISIGHPLGASGARIACKASSIMQREEAKRAIAAMCIGGGMGIAMALQSLRDVD